MTEIVSGLPASAGIAIGPAWVYHPIEITIERRLVSDSAAELVRFRKAVEQAAIQLQELAQVALEKTGAEEAAIFEAHQMFLEDPELIDSVEGTIVDEALNAEASVHDAVEVYASALSELDDEYFRARAADIRDVGQRLIHCLLGVESGAVALPDFPVIVLAEDLTPSDTVQFDRSRILGLATLRGGPTSHTAILARSMGIPAVVSLAVDLDQVKNGDRVVLDGGTGQVVMRPDAARLALAQMNQKIWLARQTADLEASQQPAITRDGHQVEVVANIGGAIDAQQAVDFGAEGVGLFRTEFLYLDRDSMPGEEEQAQAYQQVFEIMGERPVVVRTLDIGGDKAVPYLGFPVEANPFLGWRAIRMAKEYPDLFCTQFRALLRAGVGADLRIMVPMIARLRSVRHARALLEQAREGLASEGIPQAGQFQFGIMIEVPSAALIAEHIAPEVDFFSIGTNDLTQYTLAVDRTNERIADMASPFHPSVLRLIKMTIDAAHAHGKWVGLCGEFAGDPRATALLLGLGLDEFSMAPVAIPEIKALIRRLSLEDCRSLATHALALPSAGEVVDLLKEAVEG